MKKSNKYLIGIIMMVLGFIIILGNMNFIEFNFGEFLIKNIPSSILIGLGIVFHFIFFSNNRRNGVWIYFGGILLSIGIVLYLGITFKIFGYIWPGFILSNAIALFELYLFKYRKKGLLIPVAIISILSLIFFIGTLTDYVYFGRFWPTIFIMIPGIIFHLVFLLSKKNNNTGFLIPGGILLSLGVLVQIAFSFNIWVAIIPGYLLVPAIGILEFYIFSEVKDNSLLIPISILGILSLIGFSITGVYIIPAGIVKLIFPVILILVGIIIILKSKKQKPMEYVDQIHQDNDTGDEI